ncbi:cell division protein FtsA [Patescibacteria group bacterium]|jgi:cell division protein FtsA|nr:cell division protein FtsA [Patescibacteria group bacterium]
MSARTTVGIDVGSYQVRVVVSSESEAGAPKILGTGYAESRGLRHGYIINAADVRRALAHAVSAAESASGVQVRSAYVSVGGVGLEEFHSRAEVAVSRPDGVVSELDATSVMEAAERAIGKRITNRKILHAIPLAYQLDGEPVLGRPQGMTGQKLACEALFITTLSQHLEDLIAVIEELGISVVDVMAAPLAGSFVTLTKAQKMTGCVLANVGATTLSIVVYEDNTPISLKVFPVGANDITNDIALGLKISLEDAEQLKRGTLLGTNYSQKKLDDIMQARLSDMFDLIEAHLQQIGKAGLLPAGIILTGGGAGIATIEDLARNALKLPSRRATLQGLEGTRIRDASWAVAYGLTIWGLTNKEESPVGSLLRSLWRRAVGLVQRFLP